MSEYKMKAESDTIKIEVTFKNTPDVKDSFAGDKFVATPLLGVASYLRGMLLLRGGDCYAEACDELATFFTKMWEKYGLELEDDK